MPRPPDWLIIAIWIGVVVTLAVGAVAEVMGR